MPNIFPQIKATILLPKLSRTLIKITPQPCSGAYTWTPKMNPDEVHQERTVSDLMKAPCMDNLATTRAPRLTSCQQGPAVGLAVMRSPSVLHHINQMEGRARLVSRPIQLEAAASRSTLARCQRQYRHSFHPLVHRLVWLFLALFPPLFAVG